MRAILATVLLLGAPVTAIAAATYETQCILASAAKLPALAISGITRSTATALPPDRWGQAGVEAFENHADGFYALDDKLHLLQAADMRKGVDSPLSVNLDHFSSAMNGGLDQVIDVTLTGRAAGSDISYSSTCLWPKESPNPIILGPTLTN